MELAEQALGEASRTGGWAAVILVVMIVTAGYFTYLLARHVIDDHAAENRKALEETRGNYQAQLARERLTTDRYDATLQSVNTTFGEVGEIMRQTNVTLEGTRSALDQNSALLARFIPLDALAFRRGVGVTGTLVRPRRKEASAGDD